MHGQQDIRFEIFMAMCIQVTVFRQDASHCHHKTTYGA